MKGKEKCKALKEIRRQIAEQNDIAYVVEECKHKGECKGTCPKCEADVRYLERELAKKRALGQKIALAGISMGVAASFSACTKADALDVISYPVEVISDTVSNIFGGNQPDYAGDVEALGGEAVPVDDYQGGLEFDPNYVDPDVDPDVDITGDMPEDVEYDEDGNPICANPDEDVLDGEQAPEMELQGTAEADTDLYEQIIN